MATSTLQTVFDRVRSCLESALRQDKDFQMHITCQIRGKEEFRVLTISIGGVQQFTLTKENCVTD